MVSWAVCVCIVRRACSYKLQFIEKNGFENYYIFADAYDIIFIKFDYQIINYIEENNIKDELNINLEEYALHNQI